MRPPDFALHAALHELRLGKPKRALEKCCRSWRQFGQRTTTGPVRVLSPSHPSDPLQLQQDTAHVTLSAPDLGALNNPTEQKSSLVFAFEANCEASKVKNSEVQAFNAARLSECGVELVTLSSPKIVERLGVDLSKLYNDTEFVVPCTLDGSRFESWTLIALAYAAQGVRVDLTGFAPHPEAAEAAATYGELVTGAQASDFSFFDMEDVVCALHDDVVSTQFQRVFDIFDKDVTPFNAVVRTTIASAVAYVLRYTPEDVSATWHAQLTEPNGPLLQRVLWWLRLGMRDDDGFIHRQEDLLWLMAR